MTPTHTTPATPPVGPAPAGSSPTAGQAAGRGWAYIGLVLGAAVSVAANVAHSYVPPTGHPAGEPFTPKPGAVLGATFWPLALLTTSEILVRTSWPLGWRWLALRAAGLLPVAAVAAVVSYLHLHGLLLHYRENPITATIGPLSVDGLMVMATGALLATSPTRSTRSAERSQRADPDPLLASRPQADRHPADHARSDPTDRIGPAIEPSAHAIPAESTRPDPILDPVPRSAATRSLPEATARLDRIEGDRPAERIREQPEHRPDRPTRSPIADVRAADVNRAREAVRAGALPARPTAEAIRRHLGISPAYARATRDALARTVAAPSAPALAEPIEPEPLSHPPPAPGESHPEIPGQTTIQLPSANQPRNHQESRPTNGTNAVALP